MQLKIAAKTEGRVFGLANNGAFPRYAPRQHESGHNCFRWQFRSLSEFCD
ncbi:hypothetical protein [Vibrio casei]